MIKYSYGNEAKSFHSKIWTGTKNSGTLVEATRKALVWDIYTKKREGKEPKQKFIGPRLTWKTKF